MNILPVRFSFGVAVAVYLSAGVIAARADTLTIGDSAPPIVVTSFVKGTPITAAPAGKITVVEFWATWCGPCKVSIPHLTELAKKFPDVKVVGVSVWEQNQSLVAPFVTQMGAKMDYNVAMDSVPPGGNGMTGVMAKTWMAAAGQHAIPTAFIVGPDGKIDWIGYPTDMEKPLEKISAGHWDLAAAAEAFHAPAKLAALRKAGDDTATLAFAEHLVSVVYADSAESLNELAWGIVDPDAKTKATAPFIALALKAARKADALSEGKDAAIADTYAVALFANGDAPAAAIAEARAIQSAKGTPEEKDPSLQAHLDQYRKAASAVASVKVP